MARPSKLQRDNAITAEDVLMGEESAPIAGFDPGAIGEDMETSADIALMSALTEIGANNSDASVIVYQIDDRTKKDVYLYRVSVGEFAANGLEEIQRSYGAGEYRIRVFRAQGGQLTHRRVTIGAPIMRASEKAQNNAGIEALIAQQGAMMMQGFQKIAEVMAMSIQAKPAAPQGMGIQETIQLIGALQGIAGGRAPGPDPIDLVAKIVALQRDLAPPPTNGNGEVDSGAVLIKAIESFGGPLVKMMAEKQATQPAPVAPRPMPVAIPQAPALAAPVTNPIGEAPTINEREPSDMELKLQLLKGPLLVMAARGADPYTYANVILDTFEPDEIAQYIEAPDWQQKLYALIPEAANYPQWFADVRASVLEQLQEETESDNVAGNQNPAP